MMPSPIGHALAGLTVAWGSALIARAGPAKAGPHIQKAGRHMRLLIDACLLLAVAPDLDLLVATHRTWTHSLGATVLVAGAAGVAAARWRLPILRVSLACALAYGSHVVLDWLGTDSREPRGVMAFWPVSQAYFHSGLNVFAEISRRYWLPEQFVVGNLKSVARELAVLGPVTAVAYALKRQKVKGKR